MEVLAGDHRDAGAGMPVVVERAAAAGGGELVLRRAGGHFEIISDGMFLMDTRNGESERLLVRAALDRAPAGPARVLVGGLGVGFSVAEALRAGAAAVTVVEVEPAVIGWHRTHLREVCGGALDDPRVRVVRADLPALLRRDEGVYEAVCVDIDNGPDWTLSAGNARLYGEAGLRLLAARLAPGGVLAVWSAGRSPRFEERLRGGLAAVEVLRVPVPRGEPDVIYLARARRSPRRPHTRSLNGFNSPVQWGS